MAEQLIATPARFERDADRRAFNELRRRIWEYEPVRATGPDLTLEVTHGTARISGRVRTSAMKEILGYICQRTDGVDVLRNDLVSDTEVQRSVADALAEDPELGPLCLRVDVRDGVATLNGELPRPELEAQAIEAALRPPVVADVLSELVVRPPVKPPTVLPPKPPEPAPPPRIAQTRAASRGGA